MTVARLTGRVESLLELRTRANAEFFEAEASSLASCCHRMAERFARGGRLLAVGVEPVARSDVRHVAVEFVHPVIVGKRALPAIGMGPEGGSLVMQAQLLCEPDDIVIGFGSGITGALATARERGCMTIAFEGAAAEWTFDPPVSDPFVRQELVETLYHMLWELVHVFFDHRGLLEGREARAVHDAGQSAFLYPFLAESQTDLDAVLADVRASILAKSAEVSELRSQTLAENHEVLVAAAADLRACFESGATLLACGNGGSATDAADLVADLRSAQRSALDLTEDSSILSAIANDVGTAEIFQRQVIAYGREGDALVVLSTSGNSLNLISALAEARRRGLRTVAMVGYDGGRIAAEELADYVVVSRSQHIPRIQEAQASAYHALCDLIGCGD